MKLRLQLIARIKHAPADDPQDQIYARHGEHAVQDWGVSLADETVAKTVDHIEKRVRKRDRLCGFRQAVDGIKGSRQERKRRHDKVR